MKISKVIMAEVVDQIYDDVAEILKDNGVDIYASCSSIDQIEQVREELKETIQNAIEENLT